MNDKIVKIRKARVCDACGASFPAGEKMYYHVDIDSGYHAVYRCFPCKENFDAKEIERFFSYFENPTLKSKVNFNFTGTPEEYLEIKRSERKKINN